MTYAKISKKEKEKRKQENTQLKHEEFLKRMEDTFWDEYSVLGFYTTVAKKVTVKHNICNYEWGVYPSNLFSGKSKCPKCSGKLRPNTELFKKEVEELTNGEYIVLGEYINKITPVKLKHLACGLEWEVIPNNFKSKGTRCSRCLNKERYTTETFKEKIKELTDVDYELIGEYVNNRTLVTIKHIECGKNFEVYPTSFLNSNKRCGNCYLSMQDYSKGEIAIKEFLVKNKIKFHKEWSIEDCKNIKTLPFDFAIFKDNLLVSLIEFDGRQHYEPIDFFGGEKSFKETQYRDNIKNEYCKKNNIPFLRIAHWEELNIENILSDFINKLNIFN